MQITIDQILAFGPCDDYDSRERLLQLSGGKESMAALDILRLPLPAQDKLWLVLREEVIPARELRLLACKWAEGVLHFFEEKYPDDKRPRELRSQ